MKRDRPNISDIVEQAIYDPQFDSPTMAALRQQSEELKRAQAPLLADLEAAGFFVNSVWKLIDPRLPHSRALPVLLDHFSGDYPPIVRAGIARALANRLVGEGGWPLSVGTRGTGQGRPGRRVGRHGSKWSARRID